MAEALHLVTFRVGDELFGAPISAVQEIVRVPAITQIPQAPPFVEGVINLRGRVIPVVDMRKRLSGAAADGDHAKSRILVIEAGGRLVGVVVDEVSEVLKLSEERVEAAPPMVSGIGNQYITGVGKLDGRLLILIDIERVLTGEELAALAEATVEATAAA